MNALTKDQIKAFHKADSVTFMQLETEKDYKGEIIIHMDIKAPEYMQRTSSFVDCLVIEGVYSRISSYSDKMSRARYTEIFCHQSPEFQTFVSLLKEGDTLQMEFIHDGKVTDQMEEDGYHVDQFLIKIYRGTKTKTSKVLTFCLDTTTYKNWSNGMCV